MPMFFVLRSERSVPVAMAYDPVSSILSGAVVPLHEFAGAFLPIEALQSFIVQSYSQTARLVPC